MGTLYRWRLGNCYHHVARSLTRLYSCATHLVYAVVYPGHKCQILWLIWHLDIVGDGPMGSAFRHIVKVENLPAPVPAGSSEVGTSWTMTKLINCFKDFQFSTDTKTGSFMICNRAWSSNKYKDPFIATVHISHSTKVYCSSKNLWVFKASCMYVS